jgi:hypothetical protein
MSDVWVVVAGAVLVCLVVARVALARREPPAVEFADAREERLTRRLAQVVGCSLAEALPAVQQELKIAPGQSDEILLKRAAYHYRREAPEKAPCAVYRDPARG